MEGLQIRLISLKTRGKNEVSLSRGLTAMASWQLSYVGCTAYAAIISCQLQ